MTEQAPHGYAEQAAVLPHVLRGGRTGQAALAALGRCAERRWTFWLVLSLPTPLLLLGALALDSWGDECFYAWGGYRQVVQGRWLYEADNPGIYPPGAYLWWAPVQALVGPSLAALRAQGVGTALALIAVLYHMTRRRVSARAATIAIVILATSLSLTPWLATGTPYALCNLLGVLALMLASETRSVGVCVSGTLAGLLALTRHNAALGVVGGCAATLLARRGTGRDWLCLALGVAVAIASGLACFWPGIAHVWPNPPWIYLPSSYAPFAKPGWSWEELAAQLVRLLRCYGHGMLLLVVPWVTSPGCMRELPRAARARPLEFGLAVWLGLTVLVHTLGPLWFAPGLIAMYWLYAIAPACILAGAGWDRFLRSRGERMAWARWALLAVLLLLGLFGRLPSKWHWQGTEPAWAHWYRVADWVAEHIPPGERVYPITWARPHPLFLAQRDIVPQLENAPFSFTPTTEHPPAYGFYTGGQALAWLRSSRYVLVSDEAISGWRRHFPEHLATLEAVLARLFVLEAAWYGPTPGENYRIYRRADFFAPVSASQGDAGRPAELFPRH